MYSGLGTKKRNCRLCRFSHPQPTQDQPEALRCIRLHLTVYEDQRCSRFQLPLKQVHPITQTEGA